MNYRVDEENKIVYVNFPLGKEETIILSSEILSNLSEIETIVIEYEDFTKVNIIVENLGNILKNYDYKGKYILKGQKLPEYIFNKSKRYLESINPSCSVEHEKIDLISLKTIVLEESYGITNIETNEFSDYTNLETIVIPKTIRNIYMRAFYKCTSLKNVILSEGLKFIGYDVFRECSKLEEITIPSTVKEIWTEVFNHCSSLKKITIKYQGYDELEKLCKSSEMFFSDICYIEKWLFNYNKKIDLIFDGPELTIEQKMHISSLIKDKKAKITFKVKDDENLIERKTEEVNTNENKYDDDIEKLLNKINNLCNYLSDEAKNNILNMVNTLLNTYEKELKNLEPKFKNIDTSITNITFSKDIKVLKPVLISNLESIIMNLSSADDLIKFLEELNNYKNLLNTNIDALSDSNSVEDNIKNIIYLSNRLDDKRKDKELDKLSNCIDDTINKVSTNITKMYDKNSVVLLSDIDYKQEFNINISKLYDEVHSEYNRVGKYKLLLDSLVSEDNKFSDENNIIDIITSTKYIISLLSNNNYKGTLEEKFNIIKERYVEILNNIIENDEAIENTNYNDIEKDIREDLTPLLDKLNKYAYLDDYEKDKGNKINILSQLIISKGLINTFELIELSKEYELQPITSYVIEINNKVLSNEKMNDSTKENIINEIKKILDDSLDLISNKEISSLDEYNELLKTIIKSLVNIDLSIDYYIQELDNYKKYTKKNPTK